MKKPDILFPSLYLGRHFSSKKTRNHQTAGMMIKIPWRSSEAKK